MQYIYNLREQLQSRMCRACPGLPNISDLINDTSYSASQHNSGPPYQNTAPPICYASCPIPCNKLYKSPDGGCLYVLW